MKEKETGVEEKNLPSHLVGFQQQTVILHLQTQPHLVPWHSHNGPAQGVANLVRDGPRPSIPGLIHQTDQHDDLRRSLTTRRG